MKSWGTLREELPGLIAEWRSRISESTCRIDHPTVAHPSDLLRVAQDRQARDQYLVCARELEVYLAQCKDGKREGSDG